MKIKTLCLMMLSPLAVAACSTSPAFDRSFGESARLATFQQTRDPSATERNGDRPVDGIEARAASKTMDRYYKSFAEPPPPVNVFNIGLGSEGAR